MRRFEIADRCEQCHKLILTEHEIFMFNNCPDSIRLHPDEPEWQPGPNHEPIMFDNGPNRVAYVWGSHEGEPTTNLDSIGDPVVMVYEGPLEDVLWVPCHAATMEYNPEVWLWYCQPIAPKNPITDDWMRSISS